MLIDLRDISWAELSAHLNDGTVRGVDAAAYEKVTADTSFPFWEMTVGELIQVTKEVTPKRLGEWMSEELAAYDYIARRKGWQEWLNLFGDVMQRVGGITPPTAVEQYVRKSLPESTAEESMLTFTRRYFGLESFERAEAVTLGDYYLARKDDFINRLAERKASEWQEKQMRRKSRKGKNASYR